MLLQYNFRYVCNVKIFGAKQLNLGFYPEWIVLENSTDHFLQTKNLIVLLLYHVETNADLNIKNEPTFLITKMLTITRWILLINFFQIRNVEIKFRSFVESCCCDLQKAAGLVVDNRFDETFGCVGYNAGIVDVLGSDY